MTFASGRLPNICLSSSVVERSPRKSKPPAGFDASSHQGERAIGRGFNPLLRLQNFDRISRPMFAT